MLPADWSVTAGSVALPTLDMQLTKVYSSSLSFSFSPALVYAAVSDFTFFKCYQ